MSITAGCCCHWRRRYEWVIVLGCGGQAGGRMGRQQGSLMKWYLAIEAWSLTQWYLLAA